LRTKVTQADPVGFGTASRKYGPTLRHVLAGEFEANAARSAQD
jgi:hypothetical protein